MSPTLAVDLVRQAVTLCLLAAAPALLAALVIGVAISLLQALTQVQEQTLVFIPKLVVVALVVLTALPWVLSQLVEYLVGVLRSLPTLAT